MHFGEGIAVQNNSENTQIIITYQLEDISHLVGEKGEIDPISSKIVRQKTTDTFFIQEI